MNKLLIIVLILLTLGIGVYFLLPKSSKENPSPAPTTSNVDVEPQEVDIKAGFAIFTNGTFRIFTDPKYHNLSSDVYIEPINPNIVNIKKSGTAWNDFFKTLPMQLSKECLITGTKQTFCTGSSGKLKFYINGLEDPNALETEIKQGDKLLVSFGDETEAEIEVQLSKIP